MEETEKKSFWIEFKEFFSKAWKWIVAGILLIFGIKAISDSKDSDKEIKQDVKDKKKDIKEDNKEIEKDKKDSDKKEKDLKDKIKDTENKIEEAEKKDKDKDIGQFLPDLDKE